MWQIKDEYQLQKSVSCEVNLKWRIWAHGHKEWESLHTGVSCFVCRPFGKDQTVFWRSPGYCPVKMRPDQREVSLHPLGLPINPSYLQLARKSLLPVPSTEDQAPGMLHPQLTTILSPNTPERLFPPSDRPVSYEFCFFPCSLFKVLPGYLRD